MSSFKIMLSTCIKSAIVVLTLKICLSHERISSKNGKMMKTIEDNSTIETGAKAVSSGEDKKNELGPRLWAESARKVLGDRIARVQNEEKKKKLTMNLSLSTH